MPHSLEPIIARLQTISAVAQAGKEHTPAGSNDRGRFVHIESSADALVREVEALEKRLATEISAMPTPYKCKFCLRSICDTDCYAADRLYPDQPRKPARQLQRDAQDEAVRAVADMLSKHYLGKDAPAMHQETVLTVIDLIRNLRTTPGKWMDYLPTFEPTKET